VLFIGSSQTWGAGADTENDTFVMQSEKQLNSQLYVFAENTFQNVLGVISEDKASRKMDFINAGISGTNSTDLLKLYTNSWRNTLKPDLVVLNLSNNDMGNPKFESNLRKFVELNRPDIGTIFMLEANSIERTSGLAKNHEIVKRIGNELRIPVIDLHGYLSEKSDTGIIWWDYVHLTTHGQKLAAQLLTEYIRGNVASDSASKFEGYK
jgi:lysophospholipase L1-like esterase